MFRLNGHFLLYFVRYYFSEDEQNQKIEIKGGNFTFIITSTKRKGFFVTFELNVTLIVSR